MAGPSANSNDKGAKNGRLSKGSTLTGCSESAKLHTTDIAMQLQQISAKLAKLDELEKLNKDLLESVLKLSHKVDVITRENRQLKQDILDLKQSKLQKELIIKGVKLVHPEQHIEVCNKLSTIINYPSAHSIVQIKPIVFSKNKITDAVVVKFRSLEDKKLFIKGVRNLKKPLSPCDLGIQSANKQIFVQDNLTKEKSRLHGQVKALHKIGLKSSWIYRGSTWIIHPVSNERYRIKDVEDVNEIEFQLVTQPSNQLNEA